MDKLKTPTFYLKVFASAVLAIVIMIFVVLAWFVTQRVHGNNDIEAVRGKISLTEVDLASSPAYLNGEWEIYSKGEKEKSFITLPIGSITEAKKDKAYKLVFQIAEDSPDDLYLNIPTYIGDLNVYLNGKKLVKEAINKGWIDDSTRHALIPLTNLSKESDWQELVIEGKFSRQDVTLYKRPILISTIHNLDSYTAFESSSEMFLLGILLLVIINGFVFMVFRPNHKMISMMTLFDATIMLRIIFSMNYVGAFLQSIFPGLVLSDVVRMRLELFVLMLGGVMGCVLSGELYDPKKRAPRWLVVPVPILYGIFAILFTGKLEFFESTGRMILYAVYMITFIGVAWQFSIKWREGTKKGYFLFQFIKTLYIGLLVFVDILFWTSYFDFMILVYLYEIFFIMHVIIRLYDNNESYQDVEVLNKGLESTVAERTKELLDANRRLSELSTRDPLTNLYNRMYYEKAMENAFEAFTQKQEAVHLCMFDLDFFKKVNDTYGHDAGDEQLTYVASAVSGIIRDNGVVARIGGEEFVILFQGKSDTEVMEYVNYIHETIEADAKSNIKHTTASFGVVSLKSGETAKMLMKNADLALYQAKDKGRNCIVSCLDEQVV